MATGVTAPYSRLLAAGLLASAVASYTPADVRFMQGMIAHHAQAITMAAMAPIHGARADVRLLAEKIDVSQKVDHFPSGAFDDHRDDIFADVV